MGIESSDRSHRPHSAISPSYYATFGLSLDTDQGIAYAAVQNMLDRHCSDAKDAFDSGCGVGRSSRFLREAGLERVTGVDTDPEMIARARQNETPGISYQCIDTGRLPFDDNSFDLAFSGLVVLEISKPDDVRMYIAELKRVTKEDGTVVILTCTKEGYIRDTAAFQCLLSPLQKNTLCDGCPVPTKGADGKEFTDYYWSDPFIRKVCEGAGLAVVDVDLPLASLEQRAHAPMLHDKPCYAIYVCKYAAGRKGNMPEETRAQYRTKLAGRY